MTDDVSWRPAQVTHPYRGKEGVLRAMADWSEAWAAFELVLLDTIEAGPGVVILVQRTRGTARGSGIEVEQDYYGVCRVREGKLASMEQIADRAEAMAAAGLGT